MLLHSILLQFNYFSWSVIDEREEESYDTWWETKRCIPLSAAEGELVMLVDLFGNGNHELL
jgi:hypothetical protein